MNMSPMATNSVNTLGHSVWLNLYVPGSLQQGLHSWKRNGHPEAGPTSSSAEDTAPELVLWVEHPREVIHNSSGFSETQARLVPD